MQSTVVKNQQSVLDLAIQTGGSLEAIFDFALKNDISITDDLSTGLNLATTRPLSKEVFEYYQSQKISPATGFIDPEIAPLEGIDFWAIGIDFIIS